MSHEKGIEAAEEVYASMLFFGADDYYDAERIYPGIHALIKAYLDASGMVMVPRDPTDEMASAGYGEDGSCTIPELSWEKMVKAATNPFQTPEESREKR